MDLAATEAELRHLLAEVPFTRAYGFRLHAIAPGQCTLDVPFQPLFERPGGIVGGQVFMAAADVAMWLAIPAAPPATPEAIGRGARVYVKGECAECHGKEARGDGPSTKDLSVRPSDLTRRPFKNGPTAGDIVRTLLTGLDGTPMPSYYQVLEDDELWDLAYWLDSRAGPPETTDDERAGWHVERMHQRRAR